MNMFRRIITKYKKKKLDKLIRKYHDIIELNIRMLKQFPEIGVDSTMICEVEYSYIEFMEKYSNYVKLYKERPSVSYEDTLEMHNAWKKLVLNNIKKYKYHNR